MRDENGHREAIEAAYARLREKLETKDVSVEGLKSAALEALATAKTLVELDPDWIAGELNRMQGEAPAPQGQTSGAGGGSQGVK